VILFIIPNDFQFLLVIIKLREYESTNDEEEKKDEKRDVCFVGF
jgi:hypothetical protein